VLGRLLSAGDLEALGVARGLALAQIPQGGDLRNRAVNATAELLAHAPREWSSIWPVLQQNQSFGIEVLQLVAYEHLHDGFAASLDENQVADICIWMAQQGLEKAADGWGGGIVTPPIALAHWWNTLINVLTGKGNPEACRALERLTAALPQYDGLKSTLTHAREITRHATWVPLSPADVLRLTSSKLPFTLVVSIHGIRTRGAWQKVVNSELQKQGFRHELLDYGYFTAIQLLLPWSRRKKVEWFRSEYERLTLETGSLPSVIAHSFGTYIVARALETYPEIRFDRVIFCGSIVRRDFDWDSLLESARVGAVLNDWSGRDPWVKLAAWLIPDAGASGASGFECCAPGIYQRARSRFGHSDYFYPLNYIRNWVPFLAGALPENVPTESLR